MKPEAQRIAIAEACGWQVTQGRSQGLTPYGYPTIKHMQRCEVPPQLVPDYLTDLNAMHEAEKVLTAEQQAQYAMTLHEMHGIPLATFWHRVICSTAAQRAEAFLRTLGLWRDA